MDTSPWAQEIVVKPMNEIVVTNTTTYEKPPPSSLSSASSILERKVRTQKDHHHQQVTLKCPRCNSTNTKFCYYNNYSLSQPRYLCKTCRRYWTEGGSLRNIPVGGGSRKNKRSLNSSSSYPSVATANNTGSFKKIPCNNLLMQPPSLIKQQNPSSKIHESTPQDLNLGFLASNPGEGDRDFKSLAEIIQVPSCFGNNNASVNSLSNVSAMELLNGFTGSSTGLDNSGFVPMAMNSTNGTNTDHHHHLNTVYSTRFPLSAEFMKPSLSFSLDGLGNDYGNFQEDKGKLLFPFKDLKHHISHDTANDADQKENRAQHGGNSSSGFWNGVIGGGSW